LKGLKIVEITGAMMAEFTSVLTPLNLTGINYEGYKKAPGGQYGQCH
jgi:hypothetical protein